MDSFSLPLATCQCHRRALLAQDESAYSPSRPVCRLARSGRGLVQRRSVISAETLVDRERQTEDADSGLDYEIFRLNDEVTATEGANVTFYGMYCSTLDLAHCVYRNRKD